MCVCAAATPMVPTCELLHTTAPSAWTSSSLTSMSFPAFSNCLELMGRDPFLASYQAREVFRRVREVRISPSNPQMGPTSSLLCSSGICSVSCLAQIYGPVSSFSQSLIAQLGGVAVEMSMEELSSLRLTERRSIAALGAISTWSQRQVPRRYLDQAPHQFSPSVTPLLPPPARRALWCCAELHQAESQPAGLQHAGGHGPHCVWSQNNRNEPVQCCGVQVSLELELLNTVS